MVDENVLSAFQEKLQQLQQGYRQRLPDKIAEIEAIWDKLQREDPINKDTANTFHRLLHSITGSSSTHGCTDVSYASRALETYVQTWIEQGIPLLAEHTAHINHLFYDLKMVVEMVCGSGSSFGCLDADNSPMHDTPMSFVPSPSIETTVSVDMCGDDQSVSSSHIPRRWSYTSHVSFDNEDNRCIYLVEDDPILAQDLALQIGHFGYTVYAYDHPDVMKAEFRHRQPAAIVMDVVFPQGNLAGVESILEIQQSCGWNIPVMFMSARDDVYARLQAVRAGGLAYFTKPVNVPSLIDKLDELTTHREPEPYRILIIDDDPAVSAFYNLVLREHDMITYVVNNPLDFMQPLVDLRPDLILMDLYMPNCTGLELAAVIRQQESYVGIPIVFLSTETNVEKQLMALHDGQGDDFLTKAIKPDHLISVVKNRAERSRVLRGSMIRDSLTGLFNHTTTREYLHREVLFARRRHTPVSFAMIDLDKFKSVNDTYGHPVGDRVLKSLARVLQQRLRKTDIIGRYGGEEFAVILPETNGVDAFKVLDTIREDFSKIRQRTEVHEFRVTFSCGIADFPSYVDSMMITKVADESLYEAKRGGRNRVVLAT